MRFFLLASDYDGTLARDGRVSEAAMEALERLCCSGRKLVLVTGRILSELETVFPRLDHFDLIVAENGAVLHRPGTKERRQLAKRLPDSFIDELKARGVSPQIGDVILATWSPHETTVLKTIRDCGIEAQVIFNKGAVMILPSGVNKMTGLTAALEELSLSSHNTVGVGDAENDHAFLSICECSVAVANALESVKEGVDLVTERDHGDGVSELIEQILKDDVASIADRLSRHGVLLGRAGDREIVLPAYGESILVAGSSGSGKSTMVAGVLERLTAAKYQMCLIDPEGDYEDLFGAVTLGDESHAPSESEIMQLLTRPDSQVVVNLLGVPVGDRPNFFAGLLPRLQQMRAKTGRPHWLVVDEAHHMFPESWAPSSQELPDVLRSTLLITVHPEHLAKPLLEHVSTLLAVGKGPDDVIRSFAERVGDPVPELDKVELKSGETLFWRRGSKQAPILVVSEPPKGARQRHKRKYMHGALSDEECFYFRGRDGKLNLKAQNLSLFLQIAQGVDDETWNFHLHEHEYSSWFERSIKDPELAADARKVEDESASAAETRNSIQKLVEKRYTAPE